MSHRLGDSIDKNAQQFFETVFPWLSYKLNFKH